MSDQLAGGGAERFSAQLSVFLNQQQVDVHHVLVLDAIEYDYAGTIFNLGLIKNKHTGFWGRIQRFKALWSYFRTHRFDVIIDTRVKKKFWQEGLIHRWVYNAPYVLMVHSARTEWYLPKGKWGARWIYQKAAVVVAVSQGISTELREVYQLQNVQTIPGAVTTFPQEPQHFLPPFILAVGRMNDAIKQYDRLLAMYAQSTLPSQGIRLVILGEGDKLAEYKALASALNIENTVHFPGRVSNPGLYYEKALFTVLTSKNEGFPSVLLESLACGTPVIAYDCPTGPSEIIQHEINGLLVPDQDETAFIAAMERMISEKALYLQCKDQASASIASFTWEVIGAKWLEMLAKIR